MRRTEPKRIRNTVVVVEENEGGVVSDGWFWGSRFSGCLLLDDGLRLPWIHLIRASLFTMYSNINLHM